MIYVKFSNINHVDTMSIGEGPIFTRRLFVRVFFAQFTDAVTVYLFVLSFMDTPSRAWLPSLSARLQVIVIRCLLSNRVSSKTILPFI